MDKHEAAEQSFAYCRSSLYVRWSDASTRQWRHSASTTTRRTTTRRTTTRTTASWTTASRTTTTASRTTSWNERHGIAEVSTPATFAFAAEGGSYSFAHIGITAAALCGLASGCDTATAARLSDCICDGFLCPACQLGDSHPKGALSLGRSIEALC